MICYLRIDLVGAKGAESVNKAGASAAGCWGPFWYQLHKISMPGFVKRVGGILGANHLWYLLWLVYGGLGARDQHVPSRR